LGNIKIEGDVDQLIQSGSVNIVNGSKSTEQLTALQWQAIKEKVEDLEQCGFASAKETYRHLMRVFGVSRCRHILADKYQDALLEIENFKQERLQEKKRNQLIKMILDLPPPQDKEAKKYAEKKHGSSLLKVLAVEQLEEIYSYINNKNRKKQKLKLGLLEIGVKLASLLIIWLFLWFFIAKRFG
jgi:hypothetical protein